ncbi:MAG: YkvA family protein [Acidimicrobiia bacterium]|nr:YkvA family protein [Acidimicrobiia bacterium]
MGDPLRPDAVYDPTGHPIALRGMWMKEAALALPNLVKLVYRLMRDPRIPRKSKIILGAILGYLVVPIDVVPDFIPVFGQADEVLLLSYAVRHIIEAAGTDIVLEHWDGSQDVLELVESITGFAATLLPKPIQSLLRRLSAA